MPGGEEKKSNLPYQKIPGKNGIWCRHGLPTQGDSIPNWTFPNIYGIIVLIPLKKKSA